MTEVKNDKNNSDRCACPRCPSYNDCAKTKAETLYCAGEIGKSACGYKMNGCICGGCPVHTENKLKAGYYCIKGSAIEIG